MSLKNIRSEDLVVYQEQRSRDREYPQYNAGHSFTGEELEAYQAACDDMQSVDEELASRGLKPVIGEHGWELVPLDEEEAD